MDEKKVELQIIQTSRNVPKALWTNLSKSYEQHG
jgi:hypothetical protein